MKFRLRSRPLSLGNEIVIRDDSCEAECLSQLNLVVGVGKITIGKIVLTRTDRWGTVLRADFALSGSEDEQLVNRLVGWRRTDGVFQIIYGARQNVRPL